MAVTKDPVCGMEIPEEDAEDLGAVRVEHEGRSFWVCCPTCADAFRKDPERYAAASGAPGGHLH